MADHVLETSFWLPRPRPEVFAFFADPHHLERVSPASARLRWLVPPPALGVGAVRDFAVSPFGFRPPGGTWVEDRVPSPLPGGALGSTLHALGAERRILAAFAHRERRLRVLLG